MFRNFEKIVQKQLKISKNLFHLLVLTEMQFKWYYDWEISFCMMMKHTNGDRGPKFSALLFRIHNNLYYTHFRIVTF